VVDAYRSIFAWFRCYFDQSAPAQKASIAAKTEQISMLESKIAAIQ